jgi:hypothetical protein
VLDRVHLRCGATLHLRVSLRVVRTGVVSVKEERDGRKENILDFRKRRNSAREAVILLRRPRGRLEYASEQTGKGEA